MNEDIIQLQPEERVLFIINDNVIDGSTRFQKYGFLLFKQYQKELTRLQSDYSNFKFYDDWVAHNFGPYSKRLAQDIQTCVANNILDEKIIDKGKNYNKYMLSLKGRIKWRKFFRNTTDEMIKINDKIRNLQFINLTEMLRQIYDAYPEFTVNSKIKDSLN